MDGGVWRSNRHTVRRCREIGERSESCAGVLGTTIRCCTPNDVPVLKSRRVELALVQTRAVGSPRSHPASSSSVNSSSELRTACSHPSTLGHVQPSPSGGIGKGTNSVHHGLPRPALVSLA
jgi:hypothetical protein